MSYRLALCLALGFALAGGAAAQEPLRVVLYPGTCEASAAVALESGELVVADDDEKDLRVYRQGPPSAPQILKISDLHKDLKKKGDLEGAARIGEDFYWIGSHGRKKNGQEDPDRHRLFAIQVESKDGGLVPSLVGKPYTALIADLQKEARFKRYDLGNTANIEGLGVKDGDKLMIGFRSPVQGGKALIIPLNNPRQVLDGAPAVFGDPIDLDLGGLGVRSLEFWPAGKAYVLVAGPIDDSIRFQAFHWSGNPADKPKPFKDVQFASLVPEAVFFDSPTSVELVVFSDEGDACFDPKAFRSSRIKLTAPN